MDVSRALVSWRDEPSSRLTNSPAVPLMSDWNVLVAPSIDPATEATSSTPAVPKVERSGAPTTPVVPAPASASPDAPTPAPGD